MAVLGASTVTNTGPSVITGNVALTPGTAVTGFPPGTFVSGGIHVNDAIATQAHAGALAAYNQLAGETPTNNLTGQNLGGMTLTPGIYRFDTFAQLTGTLTLDTGGDPNAAFHFQIGATLTADSASEITLLNGNSVNIFWQVSSSATLGAGSTFYGTIIADQSITLETGASLEGRALALNGAVTLDTNVITAPSPTPTPTPGPTASPSPTATPGPTVSPSPTATPGPTASPSPTATPGPTASPSATATPGPTASPTATPGPTASPSPTVTPGPTTSPTATPGPTATPSPGATPSPSPGSSPTPAPGGSPIVPPNGIVLAREIDRLAALYPEHPLLRLLADLPDNLLPGALLLLSPEDLASIFTTGLAVSHIHINNIEHRLWDVRQGATGFSDSGFAVTETRSARSYDGKEMLSMDGKEVASSPPSIIRDKRWGFFITGSGEIVDVESTSTARGSSLHTGGITVGADYRITRNFVLGAAVGYANTQADLNLNGRLDSNIGKASVYGTYYRGGFYVNGVAGGGYGSVDTRRLTVGGFALGDTTVADFHALLGTGYDHHIGGWTFGPLASLRFGTVGIDDFAENGAPGSLWFNSQSQDSLRSAAGVQAAYTARFGSVAFTPFVRAQWQHEFLTSTSSIEASFISADTFTVEGPRIGRDSLLLDIGASAQLTPSVGIYSYYTSELGRENYNGQSINGGLRISF